MENQPRTTDMLLGIALGAGCGLPRAACSSGLFADAFRNLACGFRGLVQSPKADSTVRNAKKSVAKIAKAGWWILEASHMDKADLALGGLLAMYIGLAAAAFLFPEAFYGMTMTCAGLIHRLVLP
jgi:hypothetical protein